MTPAAGRAVWRSQPTSSWMLRHPMDQDFARRQLQAPENRCHSAACQTSACMRSDRAGRPLLLDEGKSYLDT